MRAMSIRWVLVVVVATLIFRVPELRAAESTLTESQLVEVRRGESAGPGGARAMGLGGSFD